MNCDRLSEFLLWCAAANYVLLLGSFGFFVIARKWIHRVHGRWFNLTAQSIDSTAYVLLGAYKLMIWFFLIIPAIVLLFSNR